MSPSYSFLARHEKAPAQWIHVPPVFIVGSARSGTTLMRLMLTAHPNISISSEGAYIYRLRSISYGDLSNPSNLEALYQDILPFLEAERFLSPPGFEQLLDWVGQFGANKRSVITFYGTWEARVLGKRELIWWGDNAPYHVHHIPFFNSLFPNCKFILMIRDPRDVCASSKVSFRWHDFDTAIGQWERALLDGSLAGLLLGPTRVTQVKYEDLVTAPREQLQYICQFLGIDYIDEMLTYYDSSVAKAISQLSHHKNLRSPVFASSVGRFRQILTQEEIATINRRLCSPMSYLGYISYEEYDEISCKRST